MVPSCFGKGVKHKDLVFEVDKVIFYHRKKKKENLVFRAIGLCQSDFRAFYFSLLSNYLMIYFGRFSLFF